MINESCVNVLVTLTYLSSLIPTSIRKLLSKQGIVYFKEIIIDFFADKGTSFGRMI